MTDHTPTDVYGGAMDGHTVNVHPNAQEGFRAQLVNKGSIVDQEKPTDPATSEYVLRTHPDDDRKVFVLDGMKWPIVQVEGAPT